MGKQNSNFAGVGSVTGGEYEKISMSGSGMITGDVVCDSFHTSGSGHAKGKVDCRGEMHTSGSFHGEGDVKAGAVHTSGSSHFGGNLAVEGLMKTSGSLRCQKDAKAKDMQTSGSARVDGDLEVENAETSGSLSIGGSLNAGKLRTSGKLEVGKDCEAEEFFSSGRLEIGGLLNAGTVEIELNSVKDSVVGEIGGERITVTWKPAASFLSRIFGASRNGMLETGAIEGDEVRLEQTRAKVVRGRNVTVGAGCYVKLVEYSGVLQVADGATVEQQVKVD